MHYDTTKYMLPTGDNNGHMYVCMCWESNLKSMRKTNSEMHNTRENNKCTIHSDLRGNPKWVKTTGKEIPIYIEKYKVRSHNTTLWNRVYQLHRALDIQDHLAMTPLSFSLSLLLSCALQPHTHFLHVCPRCIYTNKQYGLFTIMNIIII